MKINLLYYVFIFIAALGFSLTSCDKDDNVSGKEVEGHWLYVKTNVDVVVADTTIEKAVTEYLKSTTGNDQISYELKNDKTFYCYVNHAAPVKGIYKLITKDSFILDDSRGLQNGIVQGKNVYIIKDLKSEVAKELNIDEGKIVKATVVNVFERGLLNSGD